MRVGISNGNGAMCDKCGEILLSRNVIKIKASKLHHDPKKASSGIYEKVPDSSFDLCEDCYEKFKTFFKEE